MSWNGNHKAVCVIWPGVARAVPALGSDLLKERGEQNQIPVKQVYILKTTETQRKVFYQM